MSYLRKVQLIPLVAILVASMGLPTYAHESHELGGRSYHYADISTVITVNTNSTVTVEEKQTYLFQGEYHLGWRSIPHKGISAITDVQVIDNATGQSLAYSWQRLNKTDPSSWGRYTVFEDNGATNIEWYYDLGTAASTTRTWTIRYTVHGLIGFYPDYDEIYWNLFTDYDVSVDSVEATVTLPEADTVPSMAIYRSNTHASTTKEQLDDRTFRFITANVAPKEAVTAAVRWQKGVTQQSAFWLDFIKVHWKSLLAVFIFLGSIIYVIGYRLWYAHVNRGRGTIIPQYEPPQGLRPAMAQLIALGHVDNKGWAATVVDLAVRGYITIKEDPAHKHPPLQVVLFFVIIPVFFLVVLGGSSLKISIAFLLWIPVILIIIIVIIAVVSLYAKNENAYTFTFVIGKQYILTRTTKEDTSLEQYEKKFLSVLFMGKKVFSTLKMHTDSTHAGLLTEAIEELGELDMPDEAIHRVQAYRKTHSRYMFFGWLGFGLVPIVIAATAILLLSVTGFLYSESFWLGVSVLASTGIIVYILKYQRLLNHTGYLLREDWLGFKLYLEKAEQYRMQNLTPETFEKYLPYAMIFGIEKKWAKHFEAMHLQQPQWYTTSTASVYAGSSSNFASSNAFSASAFSTSFATSFSSAFASSGAGGGGSGGGGGAGGGGGGGGGGAS